MRWASAMVVAGLGLLVVTWAFSTPPGGFPDETNHYVRALAVGRGELRGAPFLASGDPAATAHVPKSCCVPGNPSAQQWVALGVRIVDIPAKLAPEHLICKPASHQAGVPCTTPFADSGTARHITTMGTLEPMPYLLPGLATRLSSNADTALALARLANALLTGVLLAVAVLALWGAPGDMPGLGAVGLVAAVTPMVLFVGASPSPSAVEVSAGVAFFALLLRLTRPDGAQRWVWTALTVVGVLLATSRSLAPVWIAINTVVIVVLRGPRPVLALLRGGRAALVTIAVVTVAGLTTVAWELAYQPHVLFDYQYFHDQLYPSTFQLDRVLDELFGAFGQIDIHLPYRGYLVWWLLLGGLAAAAVVWGRGRERFLVPLMGAGVVGVAVLLTAGVMRQDGFDIQGRHVLALAVTAPMVLGEIVYRRRESLPRLVTAGLPLAAGGAAAAVHLIAVDRAGHAYAWLGSRPPGSWSPPGGGAVWLSVATVACLLLAAGFGTAAVAAWRSGGGPPALLAPSGDAAGDVVSTAPVREPTSSPG
jgi:Predicted membrane protein (DUF2142)